MGWLNGKKIQEQATELENTIAKFEADNLCLQNGWTPWTGETTNEKAEKAIEAILSGRDYTLYPPNYQEDPVITEGKLQVDPEPKKRGWFW
jgi:hypothetical protein